MSPNKFGEDLDTKQSPIPPRPTRTGTLRLKAVPVSADVTAELAPLPLDDVDDEQDRPTNPIMVKPANLESSTPLAADVTPAPVETDVPAPATERPGTPRRNVLAIAAAVGVGVVGVLGYYGAKGRNKEPDARTIVTIAAPQPESFVEPIPTSKPAPSPVPTVEPTSTASAKKWHAPAPKSTRADQIYD